MRQASVGSGRYETLFRKNPIKIDSVYAAPVCALVGRAGAVFMDAGPNDNKTERQAQCMQKTYVLDANVLIQAPYALESFEDNHIVLPLAVLEELDGLKGADGEAGNNARQALRFLEGLRLSGDLVKGVALPSRGTVRLEVNHVDADLPQGLDPNSRAGRVLKVCRGLMDEGTPATLVSRDMVARIRAQMIGCRRRTSPPIACRTGSNPTPAGWRPTSPMACSRSLRKKGFRRRNFIPWTARGSKGQFL